MFDRAVHRAFGRAFIRAVTIAANVRSVYVELRRRIEWIQTETSRAPASGGWVGRRGAIVERWRGASLSAESDIVRRGVVPHELDIGLSGRRRAVGHSRSSQEESILAG